MNMRLAVLGATGRTGVRLVRHALDAGHDVVAVVRNPDKLQITHEKLKVEKGNIFSEESLATHFNGCDAVISCLGSPLRPFKTVTLLQDSCKIIVAAMRKTEIKKLIFMSAMSTKVDADTSRMMKWFFLPLFSGIMTDMANAEDYLVQECQDIDFVVVKPPQLTNGALSKRTVLVEERQTGSGGKLMPWAHLVPFMLGLLTDDQWNKKLIAVTMSS